MPSQRSVNEIPLKQWLSERALEEGVTTVSIWIRLRKGKYRVKERRVNKRVILIEIE